MLIAWKLKIQFSRIIVVVKVQDSILSTHILVTQYLITTTQIQVGVGLYSNPMEL